MKKGGSAGDGGALMREKGMRPGAATGEGEKG
jgi:hypothetical protein